MLSKEKHKHQPRASSRSEARLAQEQLSCHKEKPCQHGGVPILAHLHVPVGRLGRATRLRPWHVLGETFVMRELCGWELCSLEVCCAVCSYVLTLHCAFLQDAHLAN